MIDLRRASALAVLSTFTWTSVALAAVADHQQCYKIKDDAPKALYTADLVPTDPAFPTVTGCEVKVPASMLCIDVEKTNVTPIPPGAAAGLPAQKSLCYKVKCPKLDPAVTVAETDQFGAHNVIAKQTSLLCVPIPDTGGCLSAMDCDPIANGQPACAMGTCVLGFCDAGYFDCNASLVDGCEAATASDVNNCGTCNTVCSNLPNATEACTAGLCGIGTCDLGYDDCNNNPVDGCEVSVQTDPNNCGSCGLTCSLMTPNCMAGSCVP